MSVDIYIYIEASRCFFRSPCKLSVTHHQAYATLTVSCDIAAKSTVYSNANPAKLPAVPHWTRMEAACLFKVAEIQLHFPAWGKQFCHSETQARAGGTRADSILLMCLAPYPLGHSSLVCSLEVGSNWKSEPKCFSRPGKNQMEV